MCNFSYTCGKLFILNLFEANGILSVLLIMNGNVSLSEFYKRVIYTAVCIYFLIFINRIKLKVDFAILTAGFFLFFLQANAKYTEHLDQSACTSFLEAEQCRYTIKKYHDHFKPLHITTTFMVGWYILWASLPWFDPLLAAPEIKLSTTDSAKRKNWKKFV